MRTSVSGSALTISYSFFAGSVSDPLLVTDALHRLRSPTSRSVASSFDLIALGFEQHVREDRDRVLAFDDALEQLQFAQQIGLTDDQFHVVVTSRESAGRARRSLY